MKTRFLIFLLLTEIVYLAWLFFSPLGVQKEMFPCVAFCDYRLYIHRCIQEPEHYRPMGMAAHDCCYPALAYWLVGLLATGHGDGWTPSGDEMLFVDTLFLVMFLAMALYYRERVWQPFDDGGGGRRKGLWQIALLFVALIFTPAFLTALLRGNPSAWSAGLVFVFLSWYDSPSRWRRVAAALALSSAAALKISPALFGALYLRRGPTRPQSLPWSELCVAVGGFLVLFFVPFLVFGGLDAIPDWFRNAQANAGYYVHHRPIWGVVPLCQRMIAAEQSSYLRGAVALTRIAPLVCVILFFRAGSRYRQLLLLGLAMMFLTYHDYGASYILPAFMLWIRRPMDLRSPRARICGALETVAWLFLLMPLQIPDPGGLGSMNGALQNEMSFMLLGISALDVLWSRESSVESCSAAR